MHRACEDHSKRERVNPKNHLDLTVSHHPSSTMATISELQNHSFWQVSISIPKENALFIEDFFMQSGALGYYEVLYEEKTTSLSDDSTILYFFFEKDFPARAFPLLALESGGIIAEDVRVEEIKYEDYIRQFEDSFRSFQVGSRTWLVPPWDDKSAEIPNGVTRLRLAPGLAFGTGKHPTTRLMIEYLEEMDMGNEIFCEIGTGSGILAIAALLFGCPRVYAVDIEKMSIQSAYENLGLNKDMVFEKAVFEVGDFSYRPPEQASLFVANILPSVFIANDKDLLYFLNSCPRWALSGVPIEQKNTMTGFLDNHGKSFALIEKEGWLLFHEKMQ